MLAASLLWMGITTSNAQAVAINTEQVKNNYAAGAILDLNNKDNEDGTASAAQGKLYPVQVGVQLSPANDLGKPTKEKAGPSRASILATDPQGKALSKDEATIFTNTGVSAASVQEIALTTVTF